MSLTTTCIGAFPKPSYVKLPDWFEDCDTTDPTKGWAEAMEQLGDEVEKILERGTREAVLDQVNAGIDIPTDGEIARENYIHYHCRHLDQRNPLRNQSRYPESLHPPGNRNHCPHRHSFQQPEPAHHNRRI